MTSHRNLLEVMPYLVAFYVWPVCSFPNEAQVRQLMNQTSYNSAARLIQNTLAHKVVTKTEKTSALWLYGYCMASLEYTHKAEQAFLDLLTHTPDFFPKTDTSPKIMSIFLKARQRLLLAMPKNDDLLAKIKSATVINGQISIIIEAGPAIKASTTEIKVYFRTIKQAVYRSVTKRAPFEVNNQLRFDFYLKRKPHEKLFYYMELIGHYDMPFFTIGKDLAPLSLPAES